MFGTEVHLDDKEKDAKEGQRAGWMFGTEVFMDEKKANEWESGWMFGTRFGCRHSLVVVCCCVVV
jgi:hypothetical protein